MSLQPRRPPGHGSRKALAYALDIVRLRAEGHSLAAIREALEDAGVVVSISTVHREALRTDTTKPSAKPQSPGTPPRLVASTASSADRSGAPIGSTAPRSTSSPLPGKGIAEEFMRNRVTNPLLRKEPAR
jgi:hypothetical protein